MSGARRPAFFWIVLALCPVYVAIFAIALSVTIRVFGIAKAPGWTVHASRDGWFVSGIDPSGPAAGRIDPGDRLLAINGDERAAILGTSYWRAVSRGETYRVDLEHRSERLALELTMPLATRSVFDSVAVLHGLAFFVCGAALGLLRPRDAMVRLVSACMMLCGFCFLPLWAGRGFFVGREAAVYLAEVSMSAWIYPVCYHLFSRFPTGDSPGPVWRGVQWLLYALCLLVFWPPWLLNYSGVDIGGAATQFLLDHPSLYLSAVAFTTRAGWAYFLLCLVLAMVVTAQL